MSQIIRLTAIVIFAAMGAATGARADTLDFDTRFQAWSVFTFENSQGTVCYAVSKPYIWGPAEASRTHAFLHVSTYPGEKVRDELSVSFGVPLDESDRPEIVIDKAKRFSIVAHGSRAFAPDRESEQELVSALKRGRAATVTARSRSGAALEFRYSLKGIADALSHVRKHCE